jgi:hypothetical protein
MDWKDIAGTLGKAAPLLGTLIGGPAGAAIGGMVASALGTPATPDDVSAALATNPDAAVKLKQIEADRQVQLQQLVEQHAGALLAAQTAAIQADVSDRDSARKREMSVRGSTPAGLAWLVVAASVGSVAAVVGGYVTKDPALAGIVGTTLGYLMGEAKQVLNYYFGSSSSSDRKTELMADIARAP